MQRDRLPVMSRSLVLLHRCMQIVAHSFDTIVVPVRPVMVDVPGFFKVCHMV